MPMPWSRNIPPPQQVSWCHQRSGVRIQTRSPDARTQGKLIQCSYAQSVNFFLNWFLSQRRTLRCINAKGRKRSILNCVIVIEQFYSQWFNSPKFCLRKKEIITVQDKRAIKLVCQGASIAAIIGRIDRGGGCRLRRDGGRLLYSGTLFRSFGGWCIAALNYLKLKWISKTSSPPWSYFSFFLGHD